jgi:hypothetical protein
MSRGKDDPLLVLRNDAEGEAQVAAEEAWEDALPGGDGYQGPWGAVAYWASNRGRVFARLRAVAGLPP